MYELIPHAAVAHWCENRNNDTLLIIYHVDVVVAIHKMNLWGKSKEIGFVINDVEKLKN